LSVLHAALRERVGELHLVRDVGEGLVEHRGSSKAAGCRGNNNSDACCSGVVSWVSTCQQRPAVRFGATGGALTA
jgi:hypothetical protein